MREPESYRQHLEYLIEKFPDKEVLDIEEVCEVCRRHRQTLLADKTFPAKRINGKGKYFTPIPALAWWMAAKK